MGTPITNFIEMMPESMAQVPDVWWDQVLDGNLYYVRTELLPFPTTVQSFRTYGYRRAQSRGLKASIRVKQLCCFIQAWPMTLDVYPAPLFTAVEPPDMPTIHRYVPVPMPAIPMPRAEFFQALGYRPLPPRNGEEAPPEMIEPPTRVKPVMPQDVDMSRFYNRQTAHKGTGAMDLRQEAAAVMFPAPVKKKTSREFFHELSQEEKSEVRRLHIEWEQKCDCGRIAGAEGHFLDCTTRGREQLEGPFGELSRLQAQEEDMQPMG